MTGDVDEIAAVSVHAELVVFEAAALLGLVFVVLLVVPPQLLRPVCEFASLLVRTISVLHEPLAQLRLFLAGSALHGLVSRFIGGVVGRGLVGPGGGSVMDAVVGGVDVRSPAKHVEE